MAKVHVTLSYDEEHLDAIIQHVKEHRYPGIQCYLNLILNTVLVDLTEQKRREDTRKFLEQALPGSKPHWPKELGPRHPLLAPLKRDDE